MPSRPGAIRAGRAFVELFADDSKLVRGLRAAERKIKAFGASAATTASRSRPDGGVCRIRGRRSKPWYHCGFLAISSSITCWCGTPLDMQSKTFSVQ